MDNPVIINNKKPSRTIALKLVCMTNILFVYCVIHLVETFNP